MRKIFSSVLLSIDQFCRASMILIPTFRQQCNLSSRYTVSVFCPILLFLFQLERLFQLEQVVLPDRNSNDEKNPLLQALCCNGHKAICIEKINPFLSSCCIKALTFTIRSHSLKVRHDHIFEPSKFVLMGLEPLQLCNKRVPSVESCKYRLTH